MISADEARRRELGVFRGLIVGGSAMAVVWSPFIALLISRAT